MPKIVVIYKDMVIEAETPSASEEGRERELA